MLSDAAHGAYSDIYFFYSTDPKGGSNFFKWYKSVENVLTEIGEKEVPISNGIGFAVNNETGAVTYFNVSGEVDPVAQNIACVGYSMMGNSTPVDMYLSDIRPMASATADYKTSGKSGTCAGKIKVQLLSDADHGAYSDIYFFYSTDPKGGSNFFKWYKSVENVLTEIGEKEVLIPAGCGFAINNETGAASYVQLKKPLAE